MHFDIKEIRYICIQSQNKQLPLNYSFSYRMTHQFNTSKLCFATILLLFFAVITSCDKDDIAEPEIPTLISEGVYGLIRPNFLVNINTETGQISGQVLIQDLPEDIILTDLTYDEGNQLIYTIGNSTANPVLGTIDLNGNYTTIGEFALEAGTMDLVEAIAFDNSSNVLYVSASLNGGVNDFDFLSESLMSVNVSTATASFVTEVTSSAPTNEADMDYMTIANGQLYIADGAPPSADFLSFFQIGLSRITNDTTPLEEIYDGSYLPANIAVEGSTLYTAAGTHFYQMQISNPNSFQLLGETHDNAAYDGEEIRGLVIVK